jgi:hypothetical protein
MSNSVAATNTSRAGLVVIAVFLTGSLLLNVFLLRRPNAEEHAGLSPTSVQTKATAAATSSAAKTLTSTAIIEEADLETLRDTLLAAGASENRVREVIWGALRWRFRDEQSKKRLARIDRGWWKDEQRTMGITRSRQWLVDDQGLLRELVDNKMAAVMGADPTEVAVGKARYSFLPEELQAQFSRFDRDAPNGYVRTGDPEVDAIAEAEITKKLTEMRAEREQLIASLSPEQRHEWDMHYGPLASRLANDARSVPGSTEEEFRKLYRLAEEFGTASSGPNLTIGPGVTSVTLSGVISMAATTPQTAQAQQAVMERMVTELGYDRALDYLWASSQEYRAMAPLVQEANLAPGTAARFTQLAAETGFKAGAIHQDASLNLEQRRAALVALQQSARAQVDTMVPAEVQQKLPANSLQWLTQMSEGRYRLISPSAPGRPGGGNYTGSLTGPTQSVPMQLFAPPPARPTNP